MQLVAQYAAETVGNQIISKSFLELAKYSDTGSNQTDATFEACKMSGFMKKKTEKER